jgi:hypothetical protein
MSAFSQSQSTILPLPSSPHWEPTTTTFDIDYPLPGKNRPRISDHPVGGKAVDAGSGAPRRLANG